MQRSRWINNCIANIHCDLIPEEWIVICRTVVTVCVCWADTYLACLESRPHIIKNSWGERRPIEQWPYLSHEWAVCLWTTWFESTGNVRWLEIVKRSFNHRLREWEHVQWMQTQYISEHMTDKLRHWRRENCENSGRVLTCNCLLTEPTAWGLDTVAEQPNKQGITPNHLMRVQLPKTFNQIYDFIPHHTKGAMRPAMN